MNNVEQNYQFQRQKVYSLLKESRHGMTRLQIARVLGIERATICRRVAELRDRNQLWVLGEDVDPLTNTKAQYLTTNEEVYRASLIGRAE